MPTDRKLRVLVAEDREGMRTLVRALIETEDDLEVAGEASDGESALRLVEDVRPDALVLDLGLPGMDGEVVLARAHQWQPDLLIVVLSGQASALIEPKLLESGAGAVVEKGVPGWEARLLEALRAGGR